MVASSVHGALLLGALFQLFPVPGGQAPNCQEVRTAFHALHPGSKWVPENPVSDMYSICGCPRSPDSESPSLLKDERRRTPLVCVYTFHPIHNEHFSHSDGWSNGGCVLETSKPHYNGLQNY
ncbi:hypothetical protein CHARACLAT_018913 [Characodon lateralis]|uniref:Uncharacterized protein n=1 Tax=Characodon lateralis TaxID=208331 RepID=A0ABU7CYV9_9TELE|nr:hypothetical protein [Characodon lateralis]